MRVTLLLLLGHFAAYTTYFLAHLGCELLEGRPQEICRRCIKIFRWTAIAAIFAIVVIHGVHLSIELSNGRSAHHAAIQTAH